MSAVPRPGIQGEEDACPARLAARHRWPPQPAFQRVPVGWVQSETSWLSASIRQAYRASITRPQTDGALYVPAAQRAGSARSISVSEQGRRRSGERVAHKAAIREAHADGDARTSCCQVPGSDRRHARQPMRGELVRACADQNTGSRARRQRQAEGAGQPARQPPSARAESEPNADLPLSRVEPLPRHRVCRDYNDEQADQRQDADHPSRGSFCGDGTTHNRLEPFDQWTGYAETELPRPCGGAAFDSPRVRAPYDQGGSIRRPGPHRDVHRRIHLCGFRHVAYHADDPEDSVSLVQ